MGFPNAANAGPFAGEVQHLLALRAGAHHNVRDMVDVLSFSSYEHPPNVSSDPLLLVYAVYI